MAQPTRKNRIHVTVNIGNFNPTTKTNKALYNHTYRAFFAQSFKVRPARPTAREKLTDEQLEARGHGKIWKQGTKPKERECFARLATMFYLGDMARLVGAEWRLESHDHGVKRVVSGDYLAELLKEAEGLVDGKEVWLVVEK